MSSVISNNILNNYRDDLSSSEPVIYIICQCNTRFTLLHMIFDLYFPCKTKNRLLTNIECRIDIKVMKKKKKS